jgi:ornithine--oxo-acid transaminase
MKMGAILQKELKLINSPLIKEVRGRGLFIGVEIKQEAHVNGNHLAKLLKARGLLSKATHDSTIRLTPPLVINEGQIMEAVDIFKLGIKDLEKMNHEYATKKH